MTKTELIETVASRNNMQRPAEVRKVKLIINDVFNVITEMVASGDNVQVVGFGTFLMTERKAREGRNPRTGEVIQLPASKLPQFKAGKIHSRRW